MIAEVYIFDTSFDLKPFLYDFSDYKSSFLVWKIAKVPFWNEEKLWIIYKKVEKNNIKIDYEIKKWIILEIEKPLFKEDFIDIFNLLLNEKCILPHNILQLFVIKPIREEILNGKFSFDTKKDYRYTYNNQNKLTQKQLEIKKNIDTSKKNHIMLYWVTGSWKTEIYINLIKENLEKNNQTLLMVPEIILTSQLAKRIESVFWSDVLTINSSITPAKKREAWKDIYTWKAKIIVSTRSWIFYPFEKLSLIIVDEEHDNSFISSETPRYDTYEIIEKVAEKNKNIKVLYWSWTPKINHFYDFLKWKWEILYLLDEIQK